MISANPHVPIERLCRLGSKWALPWASAFAQDDSHLHVEIDVIDFESGQLGQAQSGIDEESDQGSVPTVFKSSARTRLEKCLELIVGQYRRRLLGHLRPLHICHRRRLDLPFFGCPT